MLLYSPPPVVWLSLCHSSWLWQTDNLVSWATYQAGHGRHYHGASGFSFVSFVILIKSSSGRPLFSLLFHDEIYEAAILWVCHLQGSEVIGTLMIQTRYSQGRSNSSQDCTNVDRTDPDFRDTVNATEDLLSYLQLLETGLPLLIVCLVRIILILGHDFVLNPGWPIIRCSRSKMVHAWQLGGHNSSTAWLSPPLPPRPHPRSSNLAACSSLHPCIHRWAWHGGQPLKLLSLILSFMLCYIT